MPSINTIINIGIATMSFAILLFGIVMNLKHTKKSIYRAYLVSLLSFWAAILLMMVTKFYYDGLSSIYFNRSIVPADILLLGIPSFTSLVSYPIIILNSKLFSFREWMRILSPVIIAVILYFVVNACAHSNPFETFETYDVVLQNLGSVALISRLALVIFLILCMVMVLYSIWQVTPLYTTYITENIADSDCNVDWMHNFVLHIASMGVVYFTMLFTNSILVNTLYLISMLVLFCRIIELSLFRKTSENVEALRINWNRKSGWHVAEDEDAQQPITQSSELEKIAIEIDRWMETEEPYRQVNFTTADILVRFPDLISNDIRNIFRERGETFQCYVRRYRINKACEIIKSNDNMRYNKEVFSVVGFSHYSSFSRAFVAICAITPTEYTKQIHETNGN
ncbi:MAG: helix-turn-helix domain-containing protein [Rikenellaceae bacterium]